MAGATLDSAAAFEDRARKVGLSETTLRELKEHGFATFGSLCFAVTSNPANLDDAAVDNWVGRIFNSAPPSALPGLMHSSSDVRGPELEHS